APRMRPDRWTQLRARVQLNERAPRRVRHPRPPAGRCPPPPRRAARHDGRERAACARAPSALSRGPQRSFRAAPMSFARRGCLTCMERNDFEGADHRSDASVIFVDAPPGRGPALHHHPYIETFVVQAGPARLSVEGRTIEAAAGEVVVAPAGAVHGFTTLE